MKDEKLDIKQHLAEQFSDEDFLRRELQHLHSFDADRGWSRLQERLKDSQDSEEEEDTEEGAGFFRRLMLSRQFLLRAAAVVLVLLGIGATVWYHDYTKVTPPVLNKEFAQAVRQSEKQGGEEATTAYVHEQQLPASVAKVIKAATSIPDNVKEDLLNANNVVTHVNKEHWLTLPDGTVVCLSNNSRLIYPSKFRSDRRDVFLEGEGYFIAAHSKGSRLIVHTPQGDVTDYGTEFDVDTHFDGGRGMRAILVEGSIGVSAKGKGYESMLRPGQQADVQGSGTSVSQADLAPLMAWKTGKVEFSNWPLSRLMEVMRRWYHVDVKFENAADRDIKVSGNFDRYNTLAPTLEALEVITGLTMEQQGNSIVVK